MTTTVTAEPRSIVLITGMSGAGISTAIKILEDTGYEAIDNLPLPMVETLVSQTGDKGSPLAVVVDSRSHAFSADKLRATINSLSLDPTLTLRVLLLDATDEALQRRFTETRRRHPQATDRPILDGIRRERELMASIRPLATQVIDTSLLTTPDFRRIIQGHFRLGQQSDLFIFVQSFSYKLGLPREADLVFDVRFLRNPHWDANLRNQTGLDDAVRDYIHDDPEFAVFWERFTAFLAPLLPRFAYEGKSYLTISVGCSGGRHRSVCVVEQLGVWLTCAGYKTGVMHRDLAYPLASGNEADDQSKRKGES